MRTLAVAGLFVGIALAITHAGPAAAQSMNLAPGFTALPKGAKVAIMPSDIELFEVSAGGVLEPKADWTEVASRHFKEAMLAKKQALGLIAVEPSEKDADDLAEINSLHAAVARSITLHHFGTLKLPTKNGKLDWSMGEPVSAIKKATGADYAVFSWVRDSYTGAGHVAATVALAMFGVIRTGGGGMQTGYASLVDLNTGQVLWFNRLLRPSGDLREADKAAETLNALLTDFPIAK